MLKNIKKFLFPKRYKIQTFTYYIPSPPERNSGYREKLFDKVFYNFINNGFEIISINTVANTGPKSSGMWYIATVRGELPIELEDMNDNIFMQEIDLEKTRNQKND